MAKKPVKKGAVDMADLISQAEAAQIRGVTVSAIGDLIRRGRLRTQEIGGHVFVFKSEVEGFEEQKRGWPKGKRRKGRRG
jgi:hypothetical protein